MRIVFLRLLLETRPLFYAVIRTMRTRSSRFQSKDKTFISFSVIWRPWVLVPPLESNPPFRSAVKRSTDRANPAEDYKFDFEQPVTLILSLKSL